MLNSSWQSSLLESIRLQASNPDERILFLGVGQEENGDDGAGLAVITAIRTLSHKQSRFVFLNGGAFPENQTSTIRKLSPAMVVFIDAAQMNLEPGEAKLLTLDEIGGLSASTHSLPLSTIGQYLQDDLECSVMVLGIQPYRNEPGTPLSPIIQEKVIIIAKCLAEMEI